MSSKNLPESNPEMARRSSLGNLLRTTRESRNSSLTETSTVTRISVRILTALEADDFATLPAEVFTRGFIKIYAEYLGLDPNEVLKLFTDQENLDPERPADRPYRRDILFGTAMAHPFHLLRGNPRLRIVVVLLVALLSFYTLGAIFKSLQKHPDQDSPENEVAKSLVNGQAPTLPGPPGVELPPVDGAAMVARLAGTQATVGNPPGSSTSLSPEAPSPQGQSLGREPNLATPSPATPTSPMVNPADRASVRALPGGSASPVATPASATPAEANYQPSAPSAATTR